MNAYPDSKGVGMLGKPGRRLFASDGRRVVRACYEVRRINELLALLCVC